MPKVLVEFNSIEEAQAAIFAVSGQQSAAPAPQFQPNVEAAAPAQQPYMPPAPPQPYAPQPPAPQAPQVYQQNPPMNPQQYAPQAPMAPQAPQHQQAPGPTPPQSSAQAAGQYTAAQVASSFQQYCRAHTAKAGKALLVEFGVDAATKVDPSLYAAFMGRMGANA